jgi:hypothetical protein
VIRLTNFVSGSCINLVIDLDIQAREPIPSLVSAFKTSLSFLPLLSGVVPELFNAQHTLWNKVSIVRNSIL